MAAKFSYPSRGSGSWFNQCSTVVIYLNSSVRLSNILVLSNNILIRFFCSISLTFTAMLLTLYASVLVPVYSEWICKVDLCFLDTAVCSQELRNSFLEMLIFCSITDEVKESDISLSWIAQRGLRVRKLQVTSRLTPVCDALIRSKRVSCMHIELDMLVHHQDCILTNVPNIAVHWSYELDASHLQMVGSSIIELMILMDDDKSINTIVACCPNLKRVSICNEPFLLPLIDACQLDEINDCHLDSLVKREKCKWTYSCDLKRTSEVNDDETAVRLGEGKYYHMTSLNCWREMTEKDSKLLIPLMPHLTDLFFDNDLVFKILSAAVETCRNLRTLHIDAVVDLCELRQMLLKSQSLRELYLDSDDNMKMDECVAAMSENCPLLEECCLNQGLVTSELVMLNLFMKCRFLVVFSASRWPVDSLLPFAVNIDKLHLEDVMYVSKWGRGQRGLLIPSEVSAGVLCAVFAQNPSLRSVEKYNKVENMPCVMSSIVQSCPQLTSFAIIATGLYNVDSLASLGHLMHLSSLTIREVQGLTIEIFSAAVEKKSSSLLSLTLRNCRISGDMVAVISRLCPALTSLNLDDNRDIKNADIVKLLSGCSKLEVLSLCFCSRITSEIVSSIKSPPMKSLNVYGTKITRSELAAAFDGVEGFKYSV